MHQFLSIIPAFKTFFLCLASLKITQQEKSLFLLFSMSVTIDKLSSFTGITPYASVFINIHTQINMITVISDV